MFKDFYSKKIVDTSVFCSVKYKKWLEEERARKEKERSEEIEKELKETGLKSHLFCF